MVDNLHYTTEINYRLYTHCFCFYYWLLILLRNFLIILKYQNKKKIHSKHALEWRIYVSSWDPESFLFELQSWYLKLQQNVLFCIAFSLKKRYTKSALVAFKVNILLSIILLLLYLRISMFNVNLILVYKHILKPILHMLALFISF